MGTIRTSFKLVRLTSLGFTVQELQKLRKPCYRKRPSMPCKTRVIVQEAAGTGKSTFLSKCILKNKGRGRRSYSLKILSHIICHLSSRNNSHQTPPPAHHHLPTRTHPIHTNNRWSPRLMVMLLTHVYNNDVATHKDPAML